MKKARFRQNQDASFFENEPAPRNAAAKSKWKRVAYWLFVLSLWGFVLGAIGIVIVAWDLPNVDDAIGGTRKPTVRIVTQQGVEVARRGDRYGAAVYLKDLPPAVAQAILATEDRRFYDHFGIDLFGIARAMVVNVRAGGIVQGGSTITQQAAKNLFLTPERTLRRKLQEVVLALWLEAKFTKDQIFTIYLNRVYFGQGVYGIEAAARYYFGVPAQTLSVYHSAMLAGMLKGPNKYNPYANLELAKQRTEVVLANMVAAGYISEADRKAIKRPTTWWTSANAQSKPMAFHFADWVFDQVGDYVTLDQDVTVIVTVDARLQREAETAVRAMMKKNGDAEKRNVGEVALVTLAPDGAVLAMVGGADYGQSKFNRAVQAMRQPGSAFKPIVYLAGLEAGLKPNTVLTDEPITIDGWSPSNFKNEYLGNMTLAEALTRSINTIAVKVSERAGRSNVQAMAQKLGITHDLIDAPSLALGVSEVSVLEMTAAYGAFATGGLGLWPYAISEIQDNKGRPIYVRTGGGPGRVIPAGYAGAMNSMLSNVIESEDGTGKAARIGRPAAGKTGTSQDYRDAWFIGYTPQLITGVWMGNDNGAAMNGVTGGNLPAQLWQSYMVKATSGMAQAALPNDPLPSDAPVPDTANEEAVKSFFKNMIDTLFGN